jgi:G3E family GTPase
MKAHVRLGGVVCVLDAVNGLRCVEAHREAQRQIAIADTVVVSKMDMTRAQPIDRLSEAARVIAPDARILDAQAPDFDAGALFSGSAQPASASPHGDAWSSFVLPVDSRLDWPAFTLWLSALLHAHGDRILRVKGVIRSSDSLGPLVVHGVQHVMHPPHHISPAEDDGRPGYLVFITQGIARREVETSLLRFLAMAEA